MVNIIYSLSIQLIHRIDIQVMLFNLEEQMID
ncbi:hypothetical protein BN439_3988 [Erwinia amylovora Ea644]|nr:hypothetical protein BN439_3988 [Erwinia amylovora Ea644]